MRDLVPTVKMGVPFIACKVGLSLGHVCSAWAGGRMLTSTPVSTKKMETGRVSRYVEKTTW